MHLSCTYSFNPQISPRREALLPPHCQQQWHSDSETQRCGQHHTGQGWRSWDSSPGVWTSTFQYPCTSCYEPSLPKIQAFQTSCVSLYILPFSSASHLYTHLPPPTSSAQMTLNFSQFLKPSVFSLTAKYLHMFFPSSWNAHFTLFYLINSYHCLSSSTKSFRLFWPHLIPRCLHSLLPHP